MARAIPSKPTPAVRRPAGNPTAAPPRGGRAGRRPATPVKGAASTPAVPKVRGAGRRIAGKLLLHGMALAALGYGLFYATVASRRYIEQDWREHPAGSVKVALVDRPAWMSDYLARQIAATVPLRSASPFDHELVVDTAKRLAGNPWVRQVRQVRRAYGESPGDTLVVDCDYRVPIALVKWGQYYWLVDNDGYKLPEQFKASELSQVTGGRDGQTELRVVTGVRLPPPSDGHRWEGRDLSAALDMAKLLHGKGYVDSVSGIDVSNFGGRLDRGEPQVVLDTRDHTQVWWGRPPLADDYVVEVPVARKLAILEAVFRQFGRVDGGKAWLDVRFDTALLPADPPPVEKTAGDEKSKRK